MVTISGNAEYTTKPKEAEIVLDSLTCTNCDETYDVDDVKFVEDEDDDDYVVVVCPECDAVIARFVK